MRVIINKVISAIKAKAKAGDAHLNELLKGSFVALALRIAGLAVAYVFTLIITRGFGAEVMGIFALCLTVLQIVSVLGRLGLDTALLRFVAQYTSQGEKALLKESYVRAIWLSVPFSLLLSVFLATTSSLLAEHIFNKEHLAFYFRLTSMGVLPTVLVYLHSEALRGLKRTREYIFFQFVSSFLVGSAILAAGAFFSRKAYLPLAAFIAGLTITATLSTWTWLKVAALHTIKIVRETNYRELLSVSLPMLMASSLILIMHWTDNIMIGMFRTEEEVGIYSTAARVAALTSITLFAVNSVVAPKFAGLFGKEDFQGLGRLAQQSTRLIFWTSLPIVLILFLFPSPIMGIFGNEFRAGVHALLLLTFGQFINSISGSVAYILQMTGKQKVFQNIIVVAGTFNIVLNAVLIPRYGIDGAAAASMTAMVLWNLSTVIYIRSHYKITTIYFPLATKLFGKK